jgi:HK97 family phage portal protein
VIVRTRNGEERFSFALTDMVRWGYTGLRSITPQGGENAMRGIPAIARAARIRAEAVASLRLGAWRGENINRTHATGAWQDKLFRGEPNPVQTLHAFWETAEESQAYRGNSYIWKNKNGGKVVEWWALHPDQVEVKPDGTFVVTVQPGYVDPTGKGAGKYHVDSGTVLHIRGHGQGGMRVAPSPVEQFRDAVAGPVGRQQHEARMWRRGIAGQVAISFPNGVSKDQADQWREAYRSNYEGTSGETTLVVGGGAEIKPIGLTPADAQFVDMAQLTVMDASRIMGVPANLLGVSVQQRGTPNLEQDLAVWLRFGLGTELDRIESALKHDPDLFGVPARLSAQTSGSMGIYPRFNTDGFVRGDNMTEATILQTDVQAGILLPDEARQMKGLPPLPDGAGKIPQITPVGGAPNANAQPISGGPDGPPDDVPGQEGAASVHVHVGGEEFAEAFARDAREQNEKLTGAVDRLAAAAETPAQIVVNVPPIEVPATVVNVAVPEQPAPVVNITTPEQPAPNVTVHVPDQADSVIERDPRTGLISKISRSKKKKE